MLRCIKIQIRRQVESSALGTSPPGHSQPEDNGRCSVSDYACAIVAAGFVWIGHNHLTLQGVASPLLQLGDASPLVLDLYFYLVLAIVFNAYPAFVLHLYTILFK